MTSSESQRKPIRVLSETVANQIAAGEVVERPASVVKELVENALDARATRITVSVENGGAKVVEVEDNGYGMMREDAIAALERQATSKITTADDITHISTFGFRGEAIPSIASVSRFSLITRTEESDSATEITVIGGATEQIQESGHPVGTTVRVCDLFFNVPARRKFLRTATTELARIRQTLTAIALAYPSVAFRLRSEGKDLFRLPEKDTLEDRLRTLLGAPILSSLTPVNHIEGDISVIGYISRTDTSSIGTPEHYIFINHRVATAPQIQYAVREAWPLRDRRPYVILFIDLPPELVDVNVHPAKREVRFRRGNLVVNAVTAAISKALNLISAPISSNIPHTPALSVPTLSSPKVPAPILTPAPLATAPTAIQQHLPIIVSPTHPYPTPEHPPAIITPIHPPLTPPPQTPSENVNFAWLRVADILEPGYWLVITEQGYVTVDASAALERIHYERFVHASTDHISQPLLLAETLQLSPTDADRVTRFLPELEACGFGIHPFSANTFIIDTLPVILGEVPPQTLIPQIAEDLETTGVRKGIDNWRHEVAARAAASAVARTLHIQTKEAVEELLHQLARCSMPYATPRGRPVMILTTFRELARRFQRT